MKSHLNSTSYKNKESPHNIILSKKNLDAVYTSRQDMINSIQSYNKTSMLPAQVASGKFMLKSSERIQPNMTEKHFKLPSITYRSTSKHSGPLIGMHKEYNIY